MTTNLSPAEKKAGELAKQYAEEIPEMETSEFTGEGVYRIKDIEKCFEAGFRAAIALEEVKALEDCLNAVRVHIKFPGQYENEAVIEATEKALTAWRSFRGEK